MHRHNQHSTALTHTRIYLFALHPSHSQRATATQLPPPQPALSSFLPPPCLSLCVCVPGVRVLCAIFHFLFLYFSLRFSLSNCVSFFHYFPLKTKILIKTGNCQNTVRARRTPRSHRLPPYAPRPLPSMLISLFSSFT